MAPSKCKTYPASHACRLCPQGASKHAACTQYAALTARGIAPDLSLSCTGILVEGVLFTPTGYIACVRNINCVDVEDQTHQSVHHGCQRPRPLLTREVPEGTCNCCEDDDVEDVDPEDELGQHCGACPAKHPKVQDPPQSAAACMV